MRFQTRILTGAAVAVMASVLGSLRPTTTAYAQSSASELDDPTIVAIFDAANTYDIETGALAVKKGHSSDVRDFGGMLVRDHKNVRAQGRELAKSLHVTPTPPRNFALAKAHVAAMTSLRAAKGRAFDRVFLQHEVDFHNAVIDAISKTLLPAIQNVQVKDLVTKVAPAFGAHRDRAQVLLEGLK